MEIAGSVVQVWYSQVLFLGKPKEVPYAKGVAMAELSYF